MNESEMELNVGDTILVGESLLTVVDVEGQEVVFRIEDISSHESIDLGGECSPWLTTGEENPFPPR
ncbi:MAG: hypothetical protein U0903_16855 [Planctomycetales bacterium]